MGAGYVMAMVLVNLTALGVYRLTGRFGPFHALALLSLATVAWGMRAVLRRRPGWLLTHYHSMVWSYLGLLAAACAEIAIRVPMIAASINSAGRGMALGLGICRYLHGAGSPDRAPPATPGVLPPSTYGIARRGRLRLSSRADPSAGPLPCSQRSCRTTKSSPFATPRARPSGATISSAAIRMTADADGLLRVVAVGPGGAYVIDTGFTAEMAKERRRTFLRCPIDSLELLGVEAGAVRDVILTHMHYDHVGNFHKFANARFHLQAREMAYATGKYMRYPKLGNSFYVEDVVAWSGSTSRAGWRCTRAKWRSRRGSRCTRPMDTRTG